MIPSATTADLPHADAVQTTATVESQQRIARNTFRLSLTCPTIAARIEPGQFLMLRLPGRDDPLLGRPFALYDVGEDGVSFSIGYVVIGKMTRLMAELSAGDAVEIWGPLGHGFPEPPAVVAGEPAGSTLMVAGGIGQTPFLAAGREILGAAAYGDRGRFTTPAHPPELLYGRDRRSTSRTCRGSKRPASRWTWRRTTARSGIMGSSPSCWSGACGTSHGRRGRLRAAPGR